MGNGKAIEKLPPVEQLRGRPIGRILMKMGTADPREGPRMPGDPEEASGRSASGRSSSSWDWSTRRDLQIALAAQRGMEYISIDGLDIPAEVIEKVPAQMAKTYQVLPIAYNKDKNELTVVLDNLDNFRATDDLRTLMGFTVTAKMTDRGEPGERPEQVLRDQAGRQHHRADRRDSGAMPSSRSSRAGARASTWTSSRSWRSPTRSRSC